MFKMTLRELFLLTALAGVGCAWWADHREQILRFQQLELEVFFKLQTLQAPMSGPRPQVDSVAESPDLDFKFSKGTWEDEQAQRASELAPRHIPKLRTIEN
jgi:hypothetical protein